MTEQMIAQITHFHRQHAARNRVLRLYSLGEITPPGLACSVDSVGRDNIRPPWPIEAVARIYPLGYVDNGSARDACGNSSRVTTKLSQRRL